MLRYEGGRGQKRPKKVRRLIWTAPYDGALITYGSTMAFEAPPFTDMHQSTSERPPIIAGIGQAGSAHYQSFQPLPGKSLHNERSSQFLLSFEYRKAVDWSTIQFSTLLKDSS